MALPGFARPAATDRGFRGWLMFFFVTVSIGSLLRVYLLYTISAELRIVLSSGALPMIGLVGLELSLEFTLLVATVYGLLLFANGDRRTPTYFAALFLTMLPAETLFFAILAKQLVYLRAMGFAEAFWNELMPRGFRDLVMQLIWAFYWMRSKRVRLTFGATGFEPKAKERVEIAKQVT